MNTPVSFPLAKLLKEKGFDEQWNIHMYTPTISDVVMWLHKKHKIWISVDPENDPDLWFHTISHNKSEVVFGNYSSGPTEAYESAIEYVLTSMI